MDNKFLPSETFELLHDININLQEGFERNVSKLKMILTEKQIITPSTTFQEFVNDEDLMLKFNNTLMLQLPSTLDKSRYGCDFVSDFELMLFLSENGMTTLLKRKYPKDDYGDLKDTLKSNRKKLRYMINNLQKDIIHALELEGGPSFSGVKSYRTYNSHPRNQKLNTKEELQLSFDHSIERRKTAHETSFQSPLFNL